MPTHTMAPFATIDLNTTADTTGPHGRREGWGVGEEFQVWHEQHVFDFSLCGASLGHSLEAEGLLELGHLVVDRCIK